MPPFPAKGLVRGNRFQIEKIVFTCTVVFHRHADGCPSGIRRNIYAQEKSILLCIPGKESFRRSPCIGRGHPENALILTNHPLPAILM